MTDKRDSKLWPARLEFWDEACDGCLRFEGFRVYRGCMVGLKLQVVAPG